jgi:hypothetical protein
MMPVMRWGRKEPRLMEIDETAATGGPVETGVPDGPCYEWAFLTLSKKKFIVGTWDWDEMDATEALVHHVKHTGGSSSVVHLARRLRPGGRWEVVRQIEWTSWRRPRPSETSNIEMTRQLIQRLASAFTMSFVPSGLSYATWIGTTSTAMTATVTLTNVIGETR